MTLLFLDFSGALHGWLGWLPKLQLVPAILAAHLGITAALLVVTLLFGRVYCSVLCPLGSLQDGISALSARRQGKKWRFRHSRAKSWLRYSALALFVASLFFGFAAGVSLLEPYSAFGRIAAQLLTPLYRLGNNALAELAARADSYAFHSVEVWITGWAAFSVATITLVAVGILAWRGGRTYCNTICPVGTFLGNFARLSLLRPEIDASSCNQCGLCERGCKASCINSKEMSIDRSRCVTCFNCVAQCRSASIGYTVRRPRKGPAPKLEGAASASAAPAGSGVSRKEFLAFIGVALLPRAATGQKLRADGGLAPIEEKKAPARRTRIAPPGALGIQNFKSRCTACHLCVSACPNQVLRPSSRVETFMQPEMSFERGYCRPECTECSMVCPTGAILRISAAEKSSISIGHAVWIRDDCIVNRDERQCTSCERHCPTGAITLVDRDPELPKSLKIPVIDKDRCIGCGACENLCPARPLSSIYVEGNVRHHRR